MSRDRQGHTENTVIHVRIKWGARTLDLGARFGGGVFLGFALLALLAMIVIYGQRWLGV